jgi:hypothetical protein
MLGLTAWLGGGTFADARRRAVFGTPDFGRLVASGNLLD